MPPTQNVVYECDVGCHTLTRCHMNESRHARRMSPSHAYGVASISRIVQIIGLFCKRALLKNLYSAKETCNLIILLTIATR